jgi:hypothetical protein
MIEESFKKPADAMPKHCTSHRNVFSLAYRTGELVSLNEKIRLAISQRIIYMIESLGSITSRC